MKKIVKLFGALMFVATTGIANAGTFQVCINGLDVATGQLCVNSTAHVPQQITATAWDAIHIITNGEIMSSGFDSVGNALFVVHYTAPIAKYVLARNQIFNCVVNQEATNFICRSWFAR